MDVPPKSPTRLRVIAGEGELTTLKAKLLELESGTAHLSGLGCCVGLADRRGSGEIDSNWKLCSTM